MSLEARILVLFSVLCASFALAADAPYRLVQEIPVGGEGGWDYLSVDPGAHRLYVTHSSKVVVVDTVEEKVVGEVADTPGVHGFALAPELGLGFASNGRDATASIVDLKTLETIATTPTGENPDAILYVPATREVWAFNGRGRSATVFEAATGVTVATVPLSGKPEFSVFEPDSGRVYVNIEDRNEVAVLDAHTHKVVATWPIAPGEAASGMAIDLEHHRLFVVCENALLLMLDSTNGRVVAKVPIGHGVDGVAYDPGTRLAFASNGEGTVTIAREDDPGRLSVVQTLATARSARTIALDPTTHRIYLSAAGLEPSAAGKRPRAYPGTFRVLVLGPASGAAQRGNR